jgi:hypothetical protein
MCFGGGLNGLGDGLDCSSGGLDCFGDDLNCFGDDLNCFGDNLNCVGDNLNCCADYLLELAEVASKNMEKYYMGFGQDCLQDRACCIVVTLATSSCYFLYLYAFGVWEDAFRPWTV